MESIYEVDISNSNALKVIVSRTKVQNCVMLKSRQGKLLKWSRRLSNSMVKDICEKFPLEQKTVPGNDGGGRAGVMS